MASNNTVPNGRSQTPTNHFDSAVHDEFWSPAADSNGRSLHKSDGLLPAFSSGQFSHLPTPQSPSDGNRLLKDARCAPESPLPQSSQSFGVAGRLGQRFSQRSFVDESASKTPSQSHQFLTPDSSPYVSKLTSARQASFAPSTPSRPFTSPSRLSLEASILNTAPTLNSTFEPSSPPPKTPLPPTSALSSPFIAKSKRQDQPALSNGFVERTVSQSGAADSSQSGGEMERIRRAQREDLFTHAREAETRRPDYLRRSRRAGPSDPNPTLEGDTEKSALIGIMETPVKGRRLKLFQETSEESFEESLMAGGYGRYRTADWVRQPQPLPFPASGLVGGANVVQRLEAVEVQPPTEKELKKRKRLDAFRSARPEGSSRSRLFPVELEGKGRVLLDIPNELPPIPGSPDPSPSKKRASRKKKKAVESPSKDKRSSVERAAAVVADEQVDKPNWPDTEFPWRLRTEERAEAAKAEEEERLKWIAKFLDGDSDEEEEDPAPASSESGGTMWNALPAPRMGRGKMVPLLAHPEDPRKSFQSKRVSFPTDPGDARAALLAKRSVRALSYRQQRRQRELNAEEEDEAELCICRGTDDGRELVQCDGCQTWYHLVCIGIKHISQLGREEDPWFCRRCIARSPSPVSEAEDIAIDVPTSEPTFAPTDEVPHERPSEATLYHPSPHDSPNWLPPRMPKTPTRGAVQTHPAPAWSDFSRHAPTTPKGQNHSVRIYTHHTPGSFDGYRHIHNESPFDPTSTPSRGIRFSGPFSTPKANMWTRPGPLFHTPSRPTHKLSSRSFGGPGSLSATLDDPGSRAIEQVDSSAKLHAQEDSPVRRRRSKDAAVSRRQLEESPVMRTKGKERPHESDRRAHNVES